MGYAVYDPFGDDVLDFPIGSYMDWSAHCCHGLMKAQERFPGVPKNVYEMDRNSEVLKAQQGMEADPSTRRQSIKAKFRRILVGTKRSGQLEMCVKKTHARMVLDKKEAEIKATMPTMNTAKMSAAMKAASEAA